MAGFLLTCGVAGALCFSLMSAGCGEDRAEEEGLPISEPLLEPGSYDFYGTFRDNPEYADGSGACAIPAPLGCPSVTSFCMYRLRVDAPDADGEQAIAGCSDDPEDRRYDPDCVSRFWDVAVGCVYMMPLVLSDWDGGGPVRGRLASRAGPFEALSETAMTVEEEGGGLPVYGITAWSTGLRRGSDAVPGTMVLTVPYRNNLKPPPPDGAPPGTYDPPASTTGRAICRISNPEQTTASKQALGHPLAGGHVRLVTPHAILRTVIGGVPLGSDVMSVTTWEGDFCRRDDPDRSCVPEDFDCPDLDD